MDSNIVAIVKESLASTRSLLNDPYGSERMENGSRISRSDRAWNRGWAPCHKVARYPRDCMSCSPPAVLGRTSDRCNEYLEVVETAVYSVSSQLVMFERLLQSHGQLLL